MAAIWQRQRAALHLQDRNLPPSRRHVPANRQQQQLPKEQSGLLNLALCVVGAVRSLLHPPVLESLRSDLVDASNASRTDVFLVLSETDRHASLLAQAVLRPVWILANIDSRGQQQSGICRHDAPVLMRKACLETHQEFSSLDLIRRVAHGRLQLWWQSGTMTL